MIFLGPLPGARQRRQRRMRTTGRAWGTADLRRRPVVRGSSRGRGRYRADLVISQGAHGLVLTTSVASGSPQGSTPVKSECGRGGRGEWRSTSAGTPINAQDSEVLPFEAVRPASPWPQFISRCTDVWEWIGAQTTARAGSTQPRAGSTSQLQKHPRFAGAGRVPQLNRGVSS